MRQAEIFLAALTPAVVTPHRAEIRRPVGHPPGSGSVVMCHFGHLMPPEMQKERRTIVVSTRSGSGHHRCAVVPVSKTRARRTNRYHLEFPAGRYPFFHPTEPVWAVCDHVYTVALNRLWQVNIDRRPHIPHISGDDLMSVRNLLGMALGISA